MAEHWRTALLAVVLALAGFQWGGLLWQDEVEGLERLRDEVVALREKIKPAAMGSPQQATVALQGAGPEAPDTRHAPQVWPWLQQRLQAHGLQVQALRPGAVEVLAGLPVQTVVLEVLGRWTDWLAFEQQLSQHAPWWTVTQWHVAAAGVAGQVRMQWHLRWGWRPAEPAKTLSPVPELPSWLAASRAPGPWVFDEPVTQAATADRTPEEDVGPDPARWPLQALRLMGIWQQAGVAHAVLGRGLHQIVVSPGQRVGSEGYRVWRVAEDAVIFRATDVRRPDIRLDWTGGAR